MSLVSHSLSARETISVVHITVCIGYRVIRYSGILDIMIPKSKDSDATCMILFKALKKLLSMILRLSLPLLCMGGHFVSAVTLYIEYCRTL